ncbi:MAG TPA: hypothetical protein VF298_00425 [Bacteroidales bacterium]
MKANLLCCLMIALIIGGCTQKKSTIIKDSKQLEGAWKLIYAKSIGSDSTASKFKLNYFGSQMKMWSKDHFTFVGLFKQKTTILDNFGGGTYKLNGNQYVESYLYNAAEDNVEMDVKMTLEIKNDTLVQIYPVDENGKFDPTAYNIEKYVRF